MPDTRREQQVITAFCNRMSSLFRSNWRPLGFPDPPGIDAELDCGGIKTAADHTWLDSFENYRLSNVLLGSLDDVLQRGVKLPDKETGVRLLFPAKGLPRIREVDLVTHWIPQLESIISKLPVNGKMQAATLTQPTCQIWIERFNGPFPGLRVGRMLHSGAKEELVANLQRTLESKNLQLASSKRGGWNTTLIVETVDISTINEVIVAEAFSTAAKTTKHDFLDSIFLFDDPQRNDHFMVFPLKFKGVIPPPWIWMDEFRQAQLVLVWGAKDRGKPYIDESGPIPRKEFTL